MPKKLEDCVHDVMKQGKTKQESYAICAKSTGWVRKKGGGWRKKKTKKMQEIKENHIIIQRINLLIEEAIGNKNYVYIEAIPDSNTIQKIWKYMKQIGVPTMPPQKAHTTIIYSKKLPKEKIKLKNVVINAKPKAIRIFGKGTSDSPYALVIELESTDLKNLNNYYLKKYKLTSDFKDYQPHITITYDIGRVLPGLKRLTPKQKSTIENIFSKIIPELPQRIPFITQNIEYND